MEVSMVVEDIWCKRLRSDYSRGVFEEMAAMVERGESPASVFDKVQALIERLSPNRRAARRIDSPLSGLLEFARHGAGDEDYSIN